MKTDVVVLSSGPNGLGVLRALYKKGLKTLAVTRASDDVCNFTKAAHNNIVLQSDSEKEQINEILELLLKLPESVVIIPTSDWFVSVLSDHEEILKDKHDFILPSKHIADLLIDKELETSTVGEIVPIPKTTKLTPGCKELHTLKFPVIIKPRSHKHKGLSRKNIILNSPEDLDDFDSTYSSILDNVIAQEVIPGDDNEQWVCNCFFDENHNLVQYFVFNRLKLSPPHYGVTSYAISKDNKQIVELVKKLGKQLKYLGPAMIEFKRDVRDGEYKYIEINPRLGMCNFFDTSCGINNAFATYQQARGFKINTEKAMTDDVMFLSFFEDFFSRRKDNENVFKIIKDYLSNARMKHVFIYFVWWDMKPFFYTLSKQIKEISKSLFKKLLK